MNIITNLFSLDNKLVIVAGGAGQIGIEMCKVIVDMGATVIVADIDTEMAKEKIKGLNNQDKYIIKKLDVSKEQNVIDFYKDISNNDIYGLINCFHYKGNSRKLDTDSNFFASLENYPIEAWDKVHNVNLTGTFLMIKHAIPIFKKNNKGVIVNVSSTYGVVSPNKEIYGNSGINSPVAYASSKSAILNLTRYVATHYAEYNIRCNTLTPGGVYNNQSQEFIENYQKRVPLNKMANATDYQGAIAFLISNASNYMTGSNLIVDGGWCSW